MKGKSLLLLLMIVALSRPLSRNRQSVAHLPSVLPGEFDSREEFRTTCLDYIIYVARGSMACGDCWSHAGLQYLSALLCIERKPTAVLSVYHIITCSSLRRNTPCSGQNAGAFNVIAETPTPSGSNSVSYLNPSKYCKSYRFLLCDPRDPSSDRVKCPNINDPSGRFNVEMDYQCRPDCDDKNKIQTLYGGDKQARLLPKSRDFTEKMKRIIMNNGSLITSYYVKKHFRKIRYGGLRFVTRSERGYKNELRNHYILLVGWKKDRRHGLVWIAKNPNAGKEFGEEGFFYIKMGDNVNGCEEEVIFMVNKEENENTNSTVTSTSTVPTDSRTTTSEASTSNATTATSTSSSTNCTTSDTTFSSSVTNSTLTDKDQLVQCMILKLLSKRFNRIPAAVVEQGFHCLFVVFRYIWMSWAYVGKLWFSLILAVMKQVAITVFRYTADKSSTLCFVVWIFLTSASTMANQMLPVAQVEENATLKDEMEYGLEKQKDILYRMNIVFILLAVVMLLVFFALIVQVAVAFFLYRAAKKEKKTPPPTQVIVKKERKDRSHKNTKSSKKSKKNTKKSKETKKSRKEIEDNDSDKFVSEFPSKEQMVDVELENIGEKAKKVLEKAVTFNLSMEAPPPYEAKTKENKSSAHSSASSAKENNISAPIVIPLAVYADLKTSTPTASLTNVAMADVKTRITQSDVTVTRRNSLLPEQKGSILNTAIPMTSELSTPPLPVPASVSVAAPVPVLPTAPQPALIIPGPVLAAPPAPVLQQSPAPVPTVVSPRVTSPSAGASPTAVTQSPILPMAPVPQPALPGVAEAAQAAPANVALPEAVPVQEVAPAPVLAPVPAPVEKSFLPQTAVVPLPVTVTPPAAPATPHALNDGKPPSIYALAPGVQKPKRSSVYLNLSMAKDMSQKSHKSQKSTRSGRGSKKSPINSANLEPKM